MPPAPCRRHKARSDKFPVRQGQAKWGKQTKDIVQEGVDAPDSSGGVGLVIVEPWPAAYHERCALLCGGGWAHRVERGLPWRQVLAAPGR